MEIDAKEYENLLSELDSLRIIAQENHKEINSLKASEEQLKNKLKKANDRHKLIINEFNKKVKEYESDIFLKTTEIKVLKEQMSELEKVKIIVKHKGGRKKRFDKMEIETIKMYRLQGKSIRKIASTMQCSNGTIHSIVKELD